MKIYRHWARAMGEHNLSCWRWSNASVEEARRSGASRWGVDPVVEVHDRWACVNPGAPLA